MRISSYISFLSILVASVFSSSYANAMDFPTMVEETNSSNISHIYNGGWEYYVGGGVASFDCNGDRYPELLLAGGIDKAGLYINRSTHGGKLEFSKENNSSLALENVTGAYPLDADNDGLMDVMLLRVGENILFKGIGNCEFERANETWGFDGGNAWTTSFSATFEGNNDWPTFAVGNYVDRTAPGSPWGTCHDNKLFRPNADQSGFDQGQALSPGYCALSMLFSDWNRSGKQDLRVSNDRQYYKGGQEQLWNMGTETSPNLYTKSDGWKSLKIWGMGIASADLSGNGRPEIYLTSMGDNKLRIHKGTQAKPSYTDMSHKVGTTAHRPYVGDSTLPSTGWHAQFEDINNDGFSDLFVAKGNVQAMSDFAMEDPNNLLIGTPEGKFIEVGDKAGVSSPKRSRGANLVDLNLDGLLDLIVVNREEPAQVWRNAGGSETKKTTAMGNWLALSIQQSNYNKNSIGAWIEVRAGDHVQRKEITIGGGHASGQSTWHHFGVGVAERATVRVQWPDGTWGPWVRLFANQFAQIMRGESIAAIWLPSKKANQIE